MRSKQLEQAGHRAVRLLRKRTHEQGHPFMINTSTLPTNECYLEYPDGTLQHVRLNRSINDFEAVRELSLEEQDLARKKLGIERLD